MATPARSDAAEPGLGAVYAYCDRLDVPAGQRVTVHVSAACDEVDVDLVRISATGDTETLTHHVSPVDRVPTQRVAAGVQDCRPGSSVLSPPIGLTGSSVVLHIAFLPTLLDIEHPQTIAHLGGETSLLARIEGSEVVVILAAGGAQTTIRLADQVYERYWYHLTVSVDGTRFFAEIEPRRAAVPGDRSRSVLVELPAPVSWTEVRCCLGARYGDGGADDFFNGKLEAPAVWCGDEPVAAWDFSIGQNSDVAVDPVGGYHADLVNAPTRAVTGATWRGDQLDFTVAPETYAAIHVHEDDLGDAGWEPTASIDVPPDLASGLYGVRVRGAAGSDVVPVFVTPGPQPRQRVAFLASTFTYLAYANVRLAENTDYQQSGLTDRDVVAGERELQVRAHHEFGSSLYDSHRDGSGICYSSHLRPILNLRPDWRHALQDAPRHYAADVIFPSWLEHLGVEYDVITDHGLHERGIAELSAYDVIITSSHPEYWSNIMLDAVEAYVGSGGSIMYLGANGFYWVTACDPDRGLVEIRRGQAGIRTWESEPGEVHLSLTGEPGGLWRHRGRAPNRLVGIGMTAQGWDTSTPGFVRTAASRRADLAFAFEGIDDEVIGDFGLMLGGASGDEIDRADPRLGTPPNATVIATSQPHSRYYLLANEEMRTPSPHIGGDTNSLVRSDIVCYETPGGGSVFSVGSITWAGSMAYNGFDNNVARMTENILRHLL